MENLQARLIELREKSKLTQVALSQKINIGKVSYNNYESGKNEPKIDTLIKIADYYHVSLDYLVGRHFVDEIGYLSDHDRAIIKLLLQLDDWQKELIAARIGGMLTHQN